MAVVTDNASLYAAQIATPLTKQQPSAFSGRMRVAYSYIASLTGSGEAGDYVNLMKLPAGAVIVGGWLYTEDGLGDDNDVADLGIYYDDAAGTDDVDALIDGIDVYDGATGDGKLDALPAGNIWLIGSDIAAFPYTCTHEATVVLTNTSGDFKSAKDIKCCIYYVVD
jgi:hypothetical protein